MGVHSGASLGFDAIHNLLPTRLFHYITFITRFFPNIKPSPHPESSKPGRVAVVGVQSWQRLVMGDSSPSAAGGGHEGSGGEWKRHPWGDLWVQCSPYSLPGTAQSPQPCLWLQVGAPTVPGALLVPYRSPPAQPSALGDQHIAPTLPSLSLNPLVWLPKATWSSTGIPKIHREDAGDTSTQPHGPLAALPYTALHAQRPPRALPSAPAPVKLSKQHQLHPWGAGSGDAPQSGSSCSSSSSFRPLVVTM